MLLLFIIAVTAFCATFAGGMFALRLKDKLHLVLGFSAGAVIGVAFFDLLPEALQIGKNHQTPQTILTWGAVGFLTYLLLDRVIFHYGQDAHQSDHESLRTPRRGSLGAGSLSAHSFLDGIAIGLAFQASTAIGAIVTIGVLTHDFSDGINTMNVVLKNGGSRQQALFWLSADAVTPGLGIVVTLFFMIPERFFGIILAVFFGFFLYIGASDFIPESHHAHPKFLTTVMTILGTAVIYLAVLLAGL
jgi:ZIP family zinc transporter